MFAVNDSKNLMATFAAGTDNIHQIPRTDVINLSRGGRAVQVNFSKI